MKYRELEYFVRDLSSDLKKIIPKGGISGQVLRKSSNTNFETEWATVGGSQGPQGIQGPPGNTGPQGPSGAPGNSSILANLDGGIPSSVYGGITSIDANS